MNTEQEVLKPCPFCGGTNIALLNGGLGNRFVHCDDCRATTDDGSEERAIAAWNRRSNDEQAEVGWRDLLTEAREWVELAPDLPGLDPSDEHLVRDLLKRIDAYLLASPPAVAASGVTGRNAMVVELSAMLTDYYPDDDDGTAAVSIPAKQLHRWLTAALAVGDEGIRPDLLAEMAKHPGWSIERGYRDRGDDEGGHYGWCVYDVRGGRSDLEWDLIGFGETPHEALSAAVAALPTPPSRGEGV